MRTDEKHPFFSRLKTTHTGLTDKGKRLNDFVLEHPTRVVFMTIKELAAATGVSEATVFRFVKKLGYDGYNDFLFELRDVVDTDTPAIDRLDLAAPETSAGDLLHHLVTEGIRNLQHFYKTADMAALDRIISRIEQSGNIYVIGSRLSYIPAYFLGWSLTKIRRGVHILRGSDSTSLDWLANAEDDSVVVILSTTRYPNELIRLGKAVKRLDLPLIVIADSSRCPLLPFADLSLTVASTSIPMIGDFTIYNTLIRYIGLEMARRSKTDFTDHQNRLEQIYLQNDIFFNLHQ